MGTKGSDGAVFLRPEGLSAETRALQALNHDVEAMLLPVPLHYELTIEIDPEGDH